MTSSCNGCKEAGPCLPCMEGHCNNGSLLEIQTGAASKWTCTFDRTACGAPLDQKASMSPTGQRRGVQSVNRCSIPIPAVLQPESIKECNATRVNHSQCMAWPSSPLAMHGRAELTACNRSCGSTAHPGSAATEQLSLMKTEGRKVLMPTADALVPRSFGHPLDARLAASQGGTGAGTGAGTGCCACWSNGIGHMLLAWSSVKRLIPGSDPPNDCPP
jgi:hypothetical protein